MLNLLMNLQLYFRYPDVMVHRLLGVACGAYTSTSALVDMKAVEVCLFYFGYFFLSHNESY